MGNSKNKHERTKKKIKLLFHSRKKYKLNAQNAKDEKETQWELLPNPEHFTNVINHMKDKNYKQTWL